MCLTPSSSHLIIFTASLSLHIYEDPLSETTDASPVRPSRTISKAHEAPVHVCMSDSSSNLLASGSADGVVKVWDIQRGCSLRVLVGHEESVRCLDVCGNKVVSGSYDCTCRVSKAMNFMLHLIDINNHAALGR